MPVSGITSSTTAATSQAAVQSASAISGEDFMNILIKQLQMQDPFEPMTNQEMIAQMSTIRELEMNTRLADRLELLTEQQRFSSAAGLIGKLVRGTVEDSAGNEFALQGQVTGVEFTESGDALLVLNSGQTLPISGLQEVADTSATQTALEQLAEQQQFSSAAGLLGKQVKGVVEDSAGKKQELSGQVVGLSVTESGEAVLELDTGKSLPISGLQQVGAVPVTPTTG